DPEASCLWITGRPGSGKSVLARFLVENLGVDLKPRATTICHVFCDWGSESTEESLLCMLLHQLFTIKPQLLRHAIHEYMKIGVHFRRDALLQLLHVLAKDIEFGHVIFILDGVDTLGREHTGPFLHDLFRQTRDVNTNIGP